MSAAPSRHPVIAALVSRGMRRGIARQFNAVRLSGDMSVLRLRGPLIVCANHSSWWDPAVFALLQHRFFGHCHGYGPIDAAALRRYPLLERAGLIGVDTADPGSLRRFIHRAQQVLEQGNVLWMTPQGHFADPRVRPLEVQPGFAHLLRRVPAARIVPLAIEYPFWTESRPELLLRFGRSLTQAPGENLAALVEHLEAELADTMDLLATDACARDPSRFTLLRTGRAGVGGVYDIGRRLRQWRHGQRFDARHSA